MDKVPPLAMLGPIAEPYDAEVSPDIAGNTSLDFLRAIYRDGYQPMSRRMRAAIAALPFENPKLAVTASIGPNTGLGRRIELAIERSRQVIEHRPTTTDVEADQSLCGSHQRPARYWSTP